MYGYGPSPYAANPPTVSRAPWGPNSAGNGPNASAGSLPMWAKVLMVVLALVAAAFVIAFAVVFGQHANEILDTDDCTSTMCQNGGSCVDLVGGHVCICARGWSGSSCGISRSSCNNNPCANGGTCTSLQNGDVNCICTPYFTGKTCAVRNWYCDSSSCSGNGDCAEVPDSQLTVRKSSCNCHPGWTGDSCNIAVSKCAMNPCGQHGQCVEGVDTYTCNCNNGFKGIKCEVDINECDEQSYPCTNNAACIDGINSYTCQCPAGFTGVRCETDMDDCFGNPCAGGVTAISTGEEYTSVGTCVDAIDDYYCLCGVLLTYDTASKSQPLELTSDCEIINVPS